MRSTRHFRATIATVLSLSSLIFASTYTVSKDGVGDFKSIQAAINAAGPQDEVVVLDAATYNEQVTIDSSKNGLILRSEFPQSRNKPTIIFQDKINVNPKNQSESLIDSMITFDQNGAVRVMRASGVRIEGIIIDGGGNYPFGYNAVWEGRYAIQHGNAALALYMAGDIVVRDCELQNAYFGISVKDRNEGGIFAFQNPADIRLQNTIPYSGFAKSGNHLFEYNRIHDNSVGMFFESAWDGGSTIRYNLVYENHHPTLAIATMVKELTSEGGNHCGGALMIKDMMLSPLAVYNNTFWHNSLLFIGNWKSGSQHLVFNNIYGKPDQYWQTSTTTFSTSFEMSKCFANRMHNCVYAAQASAPTLKYALITNDLTVVPHDSTYTEGALITPFPASAEIRWVETKFTSTDPASPDFLVPDWHDTNVVAFIKAKGWENAGVKNPDGTRADLGAIPSGGGRPYDIITIRPNAPVEINGARAKINFSATSRIGDLDIKGLKIASLYAVIKLDTLSSGFGSDFKAIPPANIVQILIPATAIKSGANTIEVTAPATGDFAFFEMIVEGTGMDGRNFTSAVGFIPFRKIDYLLDVVVLDKVGGTPVTSVRAGTPVVLHISARTGTTPFTNKIDPTGVFLQSPFDLSNPAGGTVTSIPDGITGSATINAAFTNAPPDGGGVDYIHVVGKWVTSNKVVGFFGSSQGVTILPGPAESIQFEAPRSKDTAIIHPGTTFLVKVKAFDTFGNTVDSELTIKTVCTTPTIGNISDSIQLISGTTGIATHHAFVTNGAADQILQIVTMLVGKPTATDTAFLRVGNPTTVTHAPSTPLKPGELHYELIDLRGRVVKRTVMQNNLMFDGRSSVFSSVSRGIYLERTTDIVTGKVTVRRRVVTGRLRGDAATPRLSK